MRPADPGILNRLPCRVQNARTCCLIESGYYIEQIFPLYRISFISVGDGFDSDDHIDGSGQETSSLCAWIENYRNILLEKTISLKPSM